MPLQIKHKCEDAFINTFTSSVRTITLTLNTTKFEFPVPLFTQTITGCEEIVYSVTFQKESGQFTTNLIDVDLSTLLFTITNPSTRIPAQSIVKITVRGTI